MMHEGGVNFPVRVDAKEVVAGLAMQGFKVSQMAYSDYEQGMYLPSTRQPVKFEEAFARAFNLNRTEAAFLVNSLGVDYLLASMGKLAWEHWSYHGLNTSERCQAFNDAIEQIREGRRLPETDIPEGMLFLGITAVESATETD